MATFALAAWQPGCGDDGNGGGPLTGDGADGGSGGSPSGDGASSGPDDGGDSGSGATGSSNGSTSNASGSSQSGSTSGSDSGSSDGGSNTGTSTGASGSTGTTTATATTNASTTGTGTSSTATATTTGSSSAATTSSTGTTSTTGGACGGGPAAIDFSYIWIANSTEGTVSKIDTRTTVEQGRYYVEDYAGNGPSTCQGPSRTSVNLDGDVAVVDRSGGVAKIIADPTKCPDLNLNNMADTSTGSTPLAWGTDECFAWRQDIAVDRTRGANPSCNGPRTVQWTAPDDLGNCMFDEPRVWVAFCNEANDNVTVWLLNGSDGSMAGAATIPGYDCNTWGPYGGTVNAVNDLWFVDRASSKNLYRVDYNCVMNAGGACYTEYQRPDNDMSGYGITIDPSGIIWMAGDDNSLFTYDPSFGMWTNYKTDLDAFFGMGPADSNSQNTLRGLMVDEAGIVWIASIEYGEWGGGSNPGLLRVDPTVSPVGIDFYGPSTLTGIQHAAGISIDVDGYVWLVDTLGDQAYKIDPDTPSSFSQVGGLEYPYTYSDMTGFALLQVVPG